MSNREQGPLEAGTAAIAQEGRRSSERLDEGKMSRLGLRSFRGRRCCVRMVGAAIREGASRHTQEQAER